MKTNEFVKGFCCCLSTIINNHECNTSEREAFGTLGLEFSTAKQLRNAGVDKFDIDTFKKHKLIK